MKKTEKFFVLMISFLLIITAAFSLTACNNNNPPEIEDPPLNFEQPQDVVLTADEARNTLRALKVPENTSVCMTSGENVTEVVYNINGTEHFYIHRQSRGFDGVLKDSYVNLHGAVYVKTDEGKTRYLTDWEAEYERETVAKELNIKAAPTCRDRGASTATTLPTH